MARLPRALALCLVAAVVARPALAQGSGDDGNAGSTVAGAALGLYSAGVIGVIGSLFPCNRTLIGPHCATIGGIAGGTVGLVTGGIAGGHAVGPIRDRARGALYGAVIGGFIGGIVQASVRQYAWDDALVVAAYGAAVGAAPEGTIIGTGIGSAAGGILWLVHPQDGLANLITFTVIGSALGGLTDWAVGAFDGDGSVPPITTSFSITIG